MGWKSTLDMDSREEVLTAIQERLDKATDEQLCNVLEELVDENNWEDTLYGHNFCIRPKGN